MNWIIKNQKGHTLTAVINYKFVFTSSSDNSDWLTFESEHKAKRAIRQFAYRDKENKYDIIFTHQTKRTSIKEK